MGATEAMKKKLIYCKKSRRLPKMKTLRNLSIFGCLFLLVFIPLRAESLPPPSPAGGNYLALDGVDDHAILDLEPFALLETFGLLLPKDTDAFTFEAWIYPTTLPKKIDAVILSQQVRLYFRNLGPEGGLRLMGGAYLARARGHAAMAFGMVKLSPNQWNHVAFQGGKGLNTAVIVNDVARISQGGQGITLADDLSHAEHPQNFTIGGFGEKIQSRIHGDHFWGHFSGYIDEVRISKVARYNIAKGRFTPPKKREKFKNDAKTVALWHFDEPSGTRKFSDTSGNAYHLVGKNGAKTDGALAIEAH
ncbi:hypothetical protein C6503_06675 [Candidatus Poribacteria bacterium]|nr:MAG: hypothetical protein C6503_06675 [Candidatus Poribacteria bacterium]